MERAGLAFAGVDTVISLITRISKSSAVLIIPIAAVSEVNGLSNEPSGVLLPAFVLWT